MLSHRRRLFSLFLIIFFIVGFYGLALKDVIDHPKEIKIIENEQQTIDLKYPFIVQYNHVDDDILELISKKDKNHHDKLYINPIKIGNTQLQVKLFGILPVKNLKVSVVPKIRVIPGGQSVGVRLNTKGVLIVGLEDIESIDGNKYNPGKKAGLEIGDSILEINSIKVKDAEHVTNIINKNKNKEVTLKVKRRDTIFHTNIIPVKCREDGEYRIGLWVRDKTAGVGTLTFFHPDTMKFGALGHAITDIDTGLLLTIENGEVVKSKVASIQQGKRGKPGEIKGIFYETSKPIGSLEKNTHFGIYGIAYKNIQNRLYRKPIEIGFQNQIKEGKAIILTTVEDNQLEAYEIYIEKVNRQRTPSTKSMIIRVTDKKLLEKSGGIVQGMSGSPIIQNSRLIGAVTHVFVNDPTKGYGVFIEWMIQEAGIDLFSHSKIANND